MLPFADKTITLYNRVEFDDTVTNKTSTTWNRTVLYGCTWNKSLQALQMGNIEISSDDYVVKIPQSTKFMEKWEYVKLGLEKQSPEKLGIEKIKNKKPDTEKPDTEKLNTKKLGTEKLDTKKLDTENLSTEKLGDAAQNLAEQKAFFTGDIGDIVILGIAEEEIAINGSVTSLKSKYKGKILTVKGFVDNTGANVPLGHYQIIGA